MEFRELLSLYGFCFDAEKVQVQAVGAEGSESMGQNRSRRVTGRPELRDDQQGIIAPWGYGADLDEEKLPKMVRKIVQRLAQRGYRLGPLRDCTINHRTGPLGA